MSLRAWYVLNGNVKNQGLGDFELTQVTAPTWAAGKLCNQALNGGAFNWTAQQTAKILNNNELSYSCWIYVGDADTRSMIFGNDNNSTNRYFSLFQYPTKNDLHWSWNTVDGGGIWAGVSNGALPTGKWTHICFAYKSGYARIYVNCEVVGSGSPKVNISSYSLAYNVILNNANHRMQDIRIYDHCLSLKEVKELSKGLCLHYKLDDQYSLGQRQHYSGITAHGYATDMAGFSRTKLANEDGYNYKMTRTPTTTANYWASIRYTPVLNHTAVNPNKYYIWSSQVRCNTWTYDGLTMRNAIANNDYSNGGAKCCDSAKADGEWHQYTRKLQLTEGKTGGSGPCYITQSAYDASTATNKKWMAPCVEYYTGSLNNTAYTYNFDFDVKEVQLIEADEFPGWIDNDGITDVVDCAGVNNKHLTNYKSCTLVPSPVYRQAYNFNQTGYCYNSSVPLSLQQFTISVWINPHSNADQAQHFMFGTFDSWPNNGVGVYRDVNKNTYSIIFKSDAESTHCSCGGQSYTLNAWTHLVIWWDGTTAKVYQNGIVKTTKTYGLNGNCLFKNIYLGNSMFNTHPDSETDDAAMSDFRVYATALSEEDILELYQTRASVDNDKNFYGYYLKEV